MSKAAGFFVLFVAIISGLIASVTVMNYIKSMNTAEASEVQVKPVIIAKVDIPSGTTLRRDHYEVVQRPVESVPEKAVADSGEVLGRMTRSTMYTGEIIMHERLVEPGSPGGLPALIPPGMRAITLKVNETISVGGFVQPGHNVDIITTIDVSSNQSRETVSKVIIQNIKVLAVGKDIETNDEKKAEIVPTVTVLVTLEQAERITLASDVGAIRLILRNYKDVDYAETDGINLTSLIPSANREIYFPPIPEWEPELVVEPTPVPSPKAHTVVVYRGSAKTELSF